MMQYTYDFTEVDGGEWPSSAWVKVGDAGWRRVDARNTGQSWTPDEAVTAWTYAQAEYDNG